MDDLCTRWDNTILYTVANQLTNPHVSIIMATIVETGEGEGAIISSHEGEHSGDFNNGAPVPISSKTRMMAILAAGNSRLLGYDVEISPLVSQDVAGYWDLSNAQRGVFVGSIHVFMIVGAIVSPSVNDRFGRRACFCVSAVILVVGLVLSSIGGAIDCRDWCGCRIRCK